MVAGTYRDDIRFPPELSARIASEIEATAWEQSGLLLDIPDVEPDAMYLAAKYADLAADAWESRRDLPHAYLPNRIVDVARRALITRIEAEIRRRAEYARRNNAGDLAGLFDLDHEWEALSGPDSMRLDWLKPEVMLMSAKAALVTMWRFECPECGMSDAELGPLDAHTLLCEVCLEEDKHVRLKRWPVDEELSALPARNAT